MRRLTTGLVALGFVLAACSTGTPPLAGGDAGSLDDVGMATAEPTPDATVPPAAPTPPTGPSQTPTPGPSATPEPSPAPSEQPSDEPSEQPSGPPEDAPDVVEDLDLDGWELRVVGLVDPARAAALNQFLARPVVAVLHAQAAQLPEDDRDDDQDAADNPAGDAAAIVERIEVGAELDDGSVLTAIPDITGASTLECPVQVEQRIVLRAGQGQRVCFTFDVPGDAEVTALEVQAQDQAASVPAAAWDELDRLDDVPSLDVGVPEGVLSLGEPAQVTVPVGGGQTAQVDMAVVDVRVVAGEDDDRIVELTTQVGSDVGVSIDRLPIDTLAAISESGVQRTRRVDVETAECDGSTAVEVPAGETAEFCVAVPVPEGTITTFARYTRESGPPRVWRILQVGGTAGPGSNA